MPLVCSSALKRIEFLARQNVFLYLWTARHLGLRIGVSQGNRELAEEGASSIPLGTPIVCKAAKQSGRPPMQMIMRMRREELAQFWINCLEEIRQTPATEQEKTRIRNWCETTLPHLPGKVRERVGNLSPSELHAMGEKEMAAHPEVVTNQIRTISRLNNVSVEQTIGEMIVSRVWLSELEKYGRLTNSDREWFKRLFLADWPTKSLDTGRKYPNYG
jgi:hypothetical protein